MRENAQKRSSGEAAERTRCSSTWRVPPAQSGSEGWASAGEAEASDQRVATSTEPRKALRTASRKGIRPLVRRSATELSATVTSLRRLLTSGLATPVGSGVTSPIQCLESCGLSTGTGMIRRRRSPASSA